MKKIISMLLAVMIVFALVPYSAFADSEIQKGTEIEFIEGHHLVNLNGNKQNVFLIRNTKEAIEFNELCEDSFAFEYYDNYFDEKALVIVYHVSEMDADYDVTSVDVLRESSDFPTLTVRYDYVQGAGEAVQGHLIVAVVNASDVADVEVVKSIRNDMFTDVIPFEDHFFSISGYDSMDNLTLYIDNLSQLDELKNYRDSSSKKDFDNYLAALDDEFFQTKSIIAIIHVFTTGEHKFDVVNVSANDEGISLKYIYDNPEVGTDEMQYTCIIIEVDKADIVSSENINVTCHSDGSVYVPPYTPAVFGDVDGNSKLTAYDYMFLKMIIMGEIDESITCDFGNYIPRSDINGDGQLTAIDYMLLKSAILDQYELPQ